jgi:phage shock protein PspC (stress-responsive transcriptional regulator)
MDKKLYRSRTNRQAAGVAGGLAEYFGVDVTIVRILFVLAAITGGPGVILYIVLWAIMPEAPSETTQDWITRAEN